MSNYLPTDLLIEILQKLPVKSIIRFTTVCKSWRSIITSAAFIASHLSNGENRTLLHRRFFRFDNNRDDHYSHLYSRLKVTEDGYFVLINSSSKLEVPFTSVRSPFFGILGSCDGLLCLSDDFFSTISYEHSDLIIWNPSVRNHVVLPKPTINPEESHIAVLGFGVASHAYVRVVRLIYCTKPKDFNYPLPPQNFSVPPQAEIFCLETWSWRRLKTNVDNVTLRPFNSGVSQAFLNGVVHWLTIEPIDDSNNTYRSSVLAFDIGDEIFREVMLPDELASETVVMLSIFVIGESLGVVKYNEDRSCDVWMMKEHCVRESWTKLYRIDLLARLRNVVGFSKSGEALLAFPDRGLVVYNPETKQTKDLENYGVTYSWHVDDYVESLFLVTKLDMLMM